MAVEIGEMGGDGGNFREWEGGALRPYGYRKEADEKKQRKLQSKIRR